MVNSSGLEKIYTLTDGLTDIQKSDLYSEVALSKKHKMTWIRIDEQFILLCWKFKKTKDKMYWTTIYWYLIDPNIVKILKKFLPQKVVTKACHLTTNPATKMGHPEITLSLKRTTQNKSHHQNSTPRTNLVTKTRHPEQTWSSKSCSSSLFSSSVSCCSTTSLGMWLRSNQALLLGI